MTIKTVAKKATKTASRYQITFPKNSSITRRITNLAQKYDGMDLSEIVKLALIKLDDASQYTNERLPDAMELQAIEDYLANPELLGVQESENFLNNLKASL
jgi:hypothetical protein